MGRNFFNRVETCFPIENEKLRKRILRECSYYMSDNCQAWVLYSHGKYEQVSSPSARRRSAQELLMTELSDA